MQSREFTPSFRLRESYSLRMLEPHPLRECPHNRIPVVAVTADVMKGTNEMCYSSGMDDYMPKVIHSILVHVYSPGVIFLNRVIPDLEN